MTKSKCPSPAGADGGMRLIGEGSSCSKMGRTPRRYLSGRTEWGPAVTIAQMHVAGAPLVESLWTLTPS
jgi:hypothetical protein